MKKPGTHTYVVLLKSLTYGHLSRSNFVYQQQRTPTAPTHYAPVEIIPGVEYHRGSQWRRYDGLFALLGQIMEDSMLKSLNMDVYQLPLTHCC